MSIYTYFNVASIDVRCRCYQLDTYSPLEAQCVFIHNALDDLITCGKTDISAANLKVITSQLHQIADDKQVSGFQDQFEVRNESVSLQISVSNPFLVCPTATQAGFPQNGDRRLL